MVFETIEYITTDKTTATIIGSVGSLLLMSVLAYLIYKLGAPIVKFHSKQTDLKLGYVENFYALKSGMIQKIAEKHDIELVFTIVEEKDEIDEMYNAISKGIKRDLEVN
jgi:cobalamin biosynthesis protein CbiD